MTPVPAPLPPGSLTVPPYHGWENIAALLVVVALAAVAAAVVLTAGRDMGGRSEWQAWLDGRKADAGAPPEDPRPGTPTGNPELTEAPGHRSE
jgi:hypothetical protein